MSIEKCIYIKRVIQNEGKSEVQICGAKGVSVECGGFSDHCEYPLLFCPDRYVPRDQIRFGKRKNKLPPVQE